MKKRHPDLLLLPRLSIHVELFMLLRHANPLIVPSPLHPCWSAVRFVAGKVQA